MNHLKKLKEAHGQPTSAENIICRDVFDQPYEAIRYIFEDGHIEIIDEALFVWGWGWGMI